MLSCPTYLLPYVLSCLPCFVPYVLSCPTWFVPYVLLCCKCLVPYMILCLTYPCLTFLLPYVPCAKRTLVSYLSKCFCTSRVLCLACSRAASNCRGSFAPRPSLASGVSSLTCSYASHVLQISCFVSLVTSLL